MFGRILVVGNDTTAMRLVATRIAAREFEVQLVGTSGEALAVADESDIDVAVLNFKDLMSEGVQLLRSLKKNRRWIEVITLNAPSSLRFSIESMKLGAYADLLIPFDIEELVGKIVEAWERRKAKRRSLSLRERFEQFAASVSFAEAGDFDTARQMLKDPKGSGQKSQKEER